MREAFRPGSRLGAEGRMRRTLEFAERGMLSMTDSNRANYLASRTEISSMRFKILITEGEDGWLVVECPSLPGCVSQGRTMDEALENIKDAIQGCLDVLGERIAAEQSQRMIEVEA